MSPKEVIQNMTLGDMGDGWVQKGAKLGDIIYEQPHIICKKKLIIGGIYREHQFLNQADQTSADIRNQEARWRRIVAKWLEATAGCEIIVMGI